MASWKNATRPEPRRSGVLRPAETARVADLRRDAPVSPVLRPFVERYWSVRWDRTGQPPFRSEVLSHPSVNVSVETGTRPRFGVRLPAVLVHGVVTRRFTVDLVGAGRVSAVKFRPGGYAAFTGGPPPRDGVVPLGSELGTTPDALLAAVLERDSDDDRAAVLDAALAPRAPEPPPAYLDLLALLDRMLDDRSLVRVEQVAALGAMSVRSLQRLFAGYVGLTPKAVLARYRLQDAAAAIDAGDVDDLAGLAASLGWFDQAHFSRDFRAVVGVPPSAYLQRARSAP
ncbi:helix-turn-helix domain-containing protein [Blastococcus sp. PRF04-17]|uniref:helix-turn-helix domain-containing protein n=1 Tax=Blastococcus sp. PRF04-17 TaxID=2933797 RepID=UPI001FF1ACDC|nr:helix-turn-helix domain-containing protein [Blastococcus sp. PRF04-17]UOY00344.1 helix-turn-helix domain-containing protein [Blastococcus sp. PRF04-17]